jgi:hypothetical protein
MAENPLISGIVFSKDRAMQLDAALRSFFLNCHDSQIISLNVIYTSSSITYLNQYVQLKQAFPTVNFVRQGDFRRDVLGLMSSPASNWSRFVLRFGGRDPFTGRYLLFMVDDNIFVRKFSLGIALAALENEKNALGFALQLGTNLNYCYPLDIPLRFPAHQAVTGEIIKYRWTDACDGLNYPLEVSSSLYRLGESARLLSGLNFSNPNLLEGQMARKASTYRNSHPYLLCYKHSVTFCNPINKVQKVYDNRAGSRMEHSPDRLAALFDEGYRIDIRSWQGFIPTACHQEVEIHFEKPEN